MDHSIRWKLLSFHVADDVKFYFPHNLYADGAVPLSELVPEFQISLGRLRGIVVEHLKTPHTFGGAIISGGERLHAIVSELCTAVDCMKDISPPRSELVRQVTAVQILNA